LKTLENPEFREETPISRIITKQKDTNFTNYYEPEMIETARNGDATGAGPRSLKAVEGWSGRTGSLRKPRPRIGREIHHRHGDTKFLNHG
jgi:hypothetical protein